MADGTVVGVGASGEGGEDGAPEARFLTGGLGQGSYTLEAIALLLTLTFLVRVIGDIISRIRNNNGRSLSSTFGGHHPEQDGLDGLWTRVMTALATVATSADGSDRGADKW